MGRCLAHFKAIRERFWQSLPLIYRRSTVVVASLRCVSLVCAWKSDTTTCEKWPKQRLKCSLRTTKSWLPDLCLRVPPTSKRSLDNRICLINVFRYFYHFWSIYIHSIIGKNRQNSRHFVRWREWIQPGNWVGRRFIARRQIPSGEKAHLFLLCRNRSGYG